MATNPSPDEPRKASGLLRKLIIALAGVLVLLVVLYFVVSSSAFLKSVILPRVSKTLNAQITVDSASISPFSQVTLEKLKVLPISADMPAIRTEPLLTADQVKVRYSLWSILRGNYVVDELTLTAPVIQVITDANGRSNLDQLDVGKESKPASPKSDQPIRLAVRNVSMKDGTIRSIEHAKDGAVKTMELGQVNVSLDRLENGQPGKVNLAANLKLDNRMQPAPGATNDLAEGKLSGTFNYTLDQNLLPQTLTGNADLAFSRTEGAYADFAGFGGTMQADVTPTEIRQLGVRFQRAGQALGRIQASGPMDLAKSEGRLKIEVQSIDRQVLNLFGASKGWDFRDSTLNATNYVDLARQGDLVGAEGKIAGRKISIKQAGQATPIVDVDVDYKLRVNLADQAAVIERLTVAGQQQQKEFLSASLDRPMTLSWAPAARGLAESTFRLGLTQFNLKDWQSVIGTNAPSGLLDLQVNVLARPDNKELTATGTAKIQNLSAQVGTNRFDQGTVSLAFDALMHNFKTLTLHQYRLDVRQRDQALIQSSGSGQYDVSKKDLNLQATAEIALPASLRQFPTPPLSASNGVIRISSAVRQRDQKYSLSGNVSLADFTGAYGDYSFQGLQSTLDYNVDLERPAVQIHSASLTLRRGYNSAGIVAANGTYDLDKGAGRFTFKMTDVNENVLASVLAPSLGDKKLASLSLNGSGSATYDPQGETSLKAGIRLTNWVVMSASGAPVSPPLNADVDVDGSMRQQVLDLRQFLLKLTPTKLARNELTAKARLDFNKTNASPSQLTIESESLDVSPYYKMFAGGKETGVSTAQPGQPPRPASAPTPAPEVKPTEPEPARLPFEQLTANVGIKRLYISEVAITNLQVAAKVNRGEVTLKPVSMTVNGAPVNATATLNLGVPGYIYDVAFTADNVPIEPLANTFTTNTPGTYKGHLVAQAQLKGAGVTGASLRKNLAGSASLNLTNMHYEIVGRKTKRLLEPISLVLRVPELMKTPIDWIAASLTAGKGQIDLSQFTVQSEAFYAESRGAIPIADVLTNSPLNLPVTLSLRRSLAEKANLLAANTPTNAVYAQLPTFVTLSGTVGDPKTDINKMVIGGLLARSLGGVGKIGGDAGSILQGLGGVLTGQPGVGSSTNAPAGTNASPAANIVQGISGLLNQQKPGAASTNAPTTATNKPAKSSPLQDLLKLIPEKRTR